MGYRSFGAREPDTLDPRDYHADAIDRDWCHQGKRLKIDGPDLLTSGGKRMQGLYDRHGFEYKAPAGEE